MILFLLDAFFEYIWIDEAFNDLTLLVGPSLACFVAFDLSFVGKGHLKPQRYVNFPASRCIALHMSIITHSVPTLPWNQMLERPLLVPYLNIFYGVVAFLVHS